MLCLHCGRESMATEWEQENETNGGQRMLKQSWPSGMHGTLRNTMRTRNMEVQAVISSDSSSLPSSTVPPPSILSAHTREHHHHESWRIISISCMKTQAQKLKDYQRPSYHRVLRWWARSFFGFPIMFPPQSENRITFNFFLAKADISKN